MSGTGQVSSVTPNSGVKPFQFQQNIGAVNIPGTDHDLSSNEKAHQDSSLSHNSKTKDAELNKFSPTSRENAQTSDNTTSAQNTNPGNVTVSSNDVDTKTELYADGKYDVQFKGYKVTAGGITTVLKKWENVKEFKKTLKNFQLNEENQSSYLDRWHIDLMGKDIPASKFCSEMSKAVSQTGSWGFVSGNEEMRQNKLRDIESKKGRGEYSEEEYKSELQRISRFWDFQPEDEDKLKAAEFVKKQQKVIDSKFVSSLKSQKAEIRNLKAKKVFCTIIRGFLSSIIGIISCLGDILHTVGVALEAWAVTNKILQIVGSSLNVFGKMLSDLSGDDPLEENNKGLARIVRGSLKSLNESIDKTNEEIELKEQQFKIPPIDFVKSIIELSVEDEYQIACTRRSVGGTLSYEQGDASVLLTYSLKRAILELLKDDDGEITAESLRIFSEKYSPGTLAKAVQSVSILPGHDSLNAAYEEYQKQPKQEERLEEPPTNQNPDEQVHNSGTENIEKNDEPKETEQKPAEQNNV